MTAVQLVAPAVPAGAVDGTGAVLQVGLVPDTTRAYAGSLLSYGINVRNRGAAAAGKVTVTARVAGGAVIVGIGAPGTTRCHERHGGRVTCTLRGLPAGGASAISITTVVKPHAVGPIHTSVAADSGKAPPGTATVATPVAASPDLAVRLRTPGRLRPGQRAVLSATVINRGPEAVRRVMLFVGAAGARLTRPRGARCLIHGVARRSARCTLTGLAAKASRLVRLTVRTWGKAPVFAAAVAPRLKGSRPGDEVVYAPRQPVHHPNHQPVHHPTSQPGHHRNHQHVHHLNHQPVHHRNHQPVHHLNHQPVHHLNHQPVHHLNHQPVQLNHQSGHQPNHQPGHHLGDQLGRHSGHPSGHRSGHHPGHQPDHQSSR